MMLSVTLLESSLRSILFLSRHRDTVIAASGFLEINSTKFLE